MAEQNADRCNLQTGQCRPLPQPPGTVSLDLALSSGNSPRLVFVQGEVAAQFPGSPELLEKWQNSQTLWVADPAGANPRKLMTGGSGAISTPQWSKDGKHLLYVRDKAIWLFDVERNSTTLIVKLATGNDKSDQSGYYGHVNPPGFAWYP